MGLMMFYKSILSYGAAWCYACDSARDDKCYDPRQEFFTDPDDLIRSASESPSFPVFSFTSASYLRTLPNGNKSIEFVEAGNKVDYCTTHLYSRWNQCDNATSLACLKTIMPSCRYRPSGLRLINCDMSLADQPGSRHCFKIQQRVGASNTKTVENVIRSCIARAEDPSHDTCQRTVSIDGKTESTWCICSDSLCNAASYLFRECTAVLSSLFFFVLIYDVRC